MEKTINLSESTKNKILTVEGVLLLLCVIIPSASLLLQVRKQKVTLHGFTQPFLYDVVTEMDVTHFFSNQSPISQISVNHFLCLSLTQSQSLHRLEMKKMKQEEENIYQVNIIECIYVYMIMSLYLQKNIFNR